MELEAASPETRKTVTVLFCDATSSTALGERMDPESLRNLMTRYFDVMREVIEFHGGVVEKFIGDAVMAVFGVPTLHEDDALRACRTAIEIRDRLATLDGEIRADQGATIQWRMGINTGEVVAGDTAAGQRMVTGDAVNVAARLEAAAAPGEILVGADTHALVRGAVTVEAVEPLNLKGKAEAVPAWRLSGAQDTTSRHARPMDAPLVGRVRPLRLLHEAFREAVEERICHLFTILGVAGVGKSRLVEEFVGSLGEQAQVASGRCLAYGHGITYWPVAEAIRDGAGIPEDDPPQATAARLRAVLEAEPEAERIAAIVGGLLGIESPPAPDEIFWAIRKTFEALARDRPLVLVFDDVHWGEPTFLDLIDHTADWTRDAPILLIIMARAELLEKRPAWGGGKRWVTTMSLEPLSEDESEELVTSLVGRAELPGELRAQIGRAAEGNPLFLEELLAKLIDDGFLVTAGGGWSALGDLRQLTIPPTIQALLAARLDGLGGEERRVIERAAVEGKVFHRGAVTDLTPEPMRGGVRDRLASLMRMELVRPDQAAFAGDEAYRFRHLLIRDAAYQALAKQTRSELHERFATWLERVAADRQAEYEEIVAYHLEQAYRYRMELGPPDDHTQELAKRAAVLLANAGERAEGRGDVPATIGLVTRALELMPADSAMRRRLRILLGSRYYEAGDALRAEQILTDAVDESDRAGDEGASALAALNLVAVRASTRSTEQADSLREAEHLATVLARVGDTDGARLAQAWAAFILFALGRAGEAIARTATLVAGDDGPAFWQREARAARGASLVWGPTPIEDAIAEIQARLDRAGQAGGMAGANRGIARLRSLQGDFARARELCARARATYEELGNQHQLVSAIGTEGEIEHLAGNYAEAVSLLRQGYEGLTATGDRSYASTTAGYLGEALLDLGDDDEAWRFGTIALDTSSSDDVISQAVGREVQARVLSRRGDHGAADKLAREAVAIMARTDYLVSHADSLVDLAHVLHEAGTASEAVAAAQQAVELYERKGATFLVERTRQLIEEWSV